MPHAHSAACSRRPSRSAAAGNRGLSGNGPKWEWAQVGMSLNGNGPKWEPAQVGMTTGEDG
jgi:hypothetical protein